MSPGEFDRVRKRLDQAIEIARSINDPEVQAHFSRYLCVMASGYLEAACRDIVTRHCSKRASPDLQRYIGKQLDRFQNPKIDRIFDLAGAFGDEKRKALETLDESWHDAVNSIVSNKNNIAHGRDSQISFGGLLAYLGLANRLLGKMRAEFPC